MPRRSAPKRSKRRSALFNNSSHKRARERKAFSKSPKSTRRSTKRRSPPGTPTISANSVTEGAKRKGRDGHFYRAERNSKGNLYWRKCGKNSGGANCRFIGPARQ